MPRETPAVSRPSQDGATVTSGAAPVDGDAIPPNAFLRVTNGGAAAITLTVVTPGTVGSGLAISDHTITVPAGATRLVGPFPENHYRQNSGTTKGLVHVDYSAVTSVTREVLAS